LVWCFHAAHHTGAWMSHKGGQTCQMRQVRAT
jgi:hypothetical protein